MSLSTSFEIFASNVQRKSRTSIERELQQLKLNGFFEVPESSGVTGLQAAGFTFNEASGAYIFALRPISKAARLEQRLARRLLDMPKRPGYHAVVIATALSGYALLDFSHSKSIVSLMLAPVLAGVAYQAANQLRFKDPLPNMLGLSFYAGDIDKSLQADNAIERALLAESFNARLGVIHYYAPECDMRHKKMAATKARPKLI